VSARRLASLLLVLPLVACGPKPAPLAHTDALEAAVDKELGGVGTCVVMLDSKTGATLFQYNLDNVCNAPRPPCGTFNVAATLIGLDDGVITPSTVFKWDKSPQPVSAWQTDADIAKAYKNQVGWWFERLASQVGAQRLSQGLDRLGYGNRSTAGPATGFWNGPQAGGKLAISTRQQAQFMRRLYGGQLPVSAQTASAVEALLVNETRTGASGGKYVMSGQTGSCATEADGSRSVGWWVGHFQSPTRDVVFAASVEAPTAPPGTEVEGAIKDIFSGQGYWPG
jgi:beta-lactamase class D